MQRTRSIDDLPCASTELRPGSSMRSPSATIFASSAARSPDETPRATRPPTISSRALPDAIIEV